ncbi:hypothetical protein CEXT_392731 [Caerostris extrusa]|uniref:Ycf15 n=1 Tax=Caerostris extrusa TaxID=172846 RepID=A0AAV4MW23_CAEEX|nr:hypothetical protein CEXT_392731 [Caerostris extrusa]
MDIYRGKINSRGSSRLGVSVCAPGHSLDNDRDALFDVSISPREENNAFRQPGATLFRMASSPTSRELKYHRDTMVLCKELRSFHT